MQTRVRQLMRATSGMAKVEFLRAQLGTAR